MSNWQLARKPIPFPVRRQCDALASPHGLLFREIRNESFPRNKREIHLAGPVWVILDRDGQGPGSSMSASNPIATVRHQKGIKT
jgi:hypothetical protein